MFVELEVCLSFDCASTVSVWRIQRFQLVRACEKFCQSKRCSKVCLGDRYEPFDFVGANLLRSLLTVLRPTKVAAGYPKLYGFDTCLA